MSKPLMVKVYSDNEMLWCYGFNSESSQMQGVTSMSYYEDGTILQIAAAIKLALAQLDFSIKPIIHMTPTLSSEEDATEEYLSEIRGETDRFILEKENA